MGGFKIIRFWLMGLALFLVTIIATVFVSRLGGTSTSSAEIETTAEQVSVQTADQIVTSFSSVAGNQSETFSADKAETKQLDQIPTAQVQTQVQTESKVLTEAQQRLVAEALQRQAERDQILEDRRIAAENSPLGESIYGKVPPKKAAQATAEMGAGQATGGLPALAPLDDFAQLTQAQIASAPAGDLRQTLAPGTVIGAALMGEIRSELPGLVRAMVTADVFDSTSLRYVVIPRGSQLVGSYTNTTTTGQKRLFVYWTSVRLPDGRIFDLGRSGALDANGASGLTGQRQSGFLSTLVQATLLGMAQNAAGAQTSSSDLVNAAKIASGQAVGSVTERYLTEKLAAGPRFTIAAGTVVNVILEQPFTFPQGAASEDHGALEVTPALIQPVAWTVPLRVAPQTAQPLQVLGRKLDLGQSGPTEQSTTEFPAYDRNAYGGGWGDSDGDCRNTRQEVLAEVSTTPVTYSATGCTVAHGRWLDPYTGIVFSAAQDLDIDHLVPLAWAHVHGAGLWPPERKAAFANDKRNLFAVQSSVNREKGAKSPMEWLPPNAAFQCEYTLRFERMARTWGLSLRGDEVSGLARIKAERCA